MLHVLFVYQGLVTTSSELKILWEHNDLLVDCISKELECFVNEASKVGLIHPAVRQTLLSLSANTNEKARSLLMTIEGKVGEQPLYFHHLLAVLTNLPQSEMEAVATTLQKKYGNLSVCVILHLCM